MSAMAPLLISAAAATLLALIHLGASGLRFLNVEPRSFWLSLGGGSSVAYVFLHLLPELQHHQREMAEVAEAAVPWWDALDRHVYLLALLGLTVFYGLERLALRDRHGQGKGSAGASSHRQRSASAEADEATGDAVSAGGEPSSSTSGATFWLSMSGFMVYNALVGYLLVEQLQKGLGPLALFTVAMALHFLVNDYGLRAHHQRRYQHTGRWVLAAAVWLGMVLGMLDAIPPVALSVLTAVLAGGVVLNVLKEELPAARNSSFGAFLLGAVGYGGLLLML